MHFVIFWVVKLSFKGLYVRLVNGDNCKYIDGGIVILSALLMMLDLPNKHDSVAWILSSPELANFVIYSVKT